MDIRIDNGVLSEQLVAVARTRRMMKMSPLSLRRFWQLSDSFARSNPRAQLVEFPLAAAAVRQPARHAKRLGPGAMEIPVVVRTTERRVSSHESTGSMIIHLLVAHPCRCKIE